MSLVINNNMMAANAARTLNTHYGNLATSTQRLSSGLRINSAADDAAGLAIRELMRADIAAYNQGIRNSNDAISMIQVVDGALGIIDEKLIRMKELAEQAATGTYDSTQRLMIDSEFQAMASEIQRIATATDFNGIKLIDGSKSKVIPSHIKIGVPVINQSTIPGDSTSQRQVVSTYVDEKIVSVVENVTSTTTYYMDEDRLYKQVKQEKEIVTTTTSNRLWGDVGSAGVSNIYTDEAFNNGLRDYFGGSLLHEDSYEILATFDQANSPDWMESPTSSYYIYENNPENFVSGRPDYNHRYVFNYDLNNDGVDDIQMNILANRDMGINWYKDNVHFSKMTAHKWTINTYSAKRYESSDSVEEVPLEDNSQITIHFGPMNDSAEDYYDIEKRDCTLKGLGLEDVRIETQDNAQKSLVTINEAIVKKDQARAYYGAMQNRLENTVSNLTIQSENLQASESRISDVDVATEMTNFVRNQILTQSAVAMLSQANSMPQMAMQLIRG